MARPITNLLRSAFLLSLYVAASAPAEAQTLSDMISPVSNPVNFEDPRINTELRPIFAHHEIDPDFVTAGGNVQLYALQLRAAITDRLAFIATKDGFVDFNPNEVLPEETGIANITPGFKYVFYMDEETGKIATMGLRYEIPLGDKDVLQGQGDGQINPFFSGALHLAGFNVTAGTGLRIPVNGNDSTFYDFDLHVDYPVAGFYPSLELNVVHVLNAGNRLGIADEGMDLFNFGSTEAEGETIVTAGPAVRYRFMDNLDAGVAYQVPLNRGTGSNIVDWRITADLVISFNLI